MAYDTGNIPALMELIYKESVTEQDKIAVAAALKDLARSRGISDISVYKALYNTFEGPVFYYP